MPKKKKTKRSGMLLAIVATSLSLSGLAYAGWNWLNGLVCEEIIVSGNEHATKEEIIAVARVDTGVRLFHIEPSLIEDRVRRHPWVLSADIVRLPPGALSIEIEERRPVLLALDAGGVPTSYVDAAGFTMPMMGEDLFDVPLLHRARLPKNFAQPVQNSALLELVSVLERIDPDEATLISSFEVEPSGEISMRTIPAAARGSIYVRLGRSGFDEKFSRLTAFWEQALLSRPELRFDLIDLRFDSQIVTREAPSGREAGDPTASGRKAGDLAES